MERTVVEAATGAQVTRSASEATSSRVPVATPTDGVGAAGRDHTSAIIAAAALVAAGLTVLQLSRPGFLFGESKDVGTYLGAAIRLLHGALPYRDYVYVQPPGFVLLASPYALISELAGSRAALVALRLTTPALSAASVVMVGILLRHRGHRATLVGCGLLALWPAVFFSLDNGMLEPFENLFCLIGASLAFNRDALAGARRLFIAGVLFGLAGTVKAPAILPVVVLVVLCWPQVRYHLVPFASGVVAGFAVPVLPFLVSAPSAFFRDVVATQLLRSPGAGGRASIGLRLGALTFGGRGLVILLQLAVLAGVVLLALAVPKRLSPLEWFALGATALTGAAQFGTVQYYPQYAAFVAPFAALLLGISVGRIGSWRMPRLTSAVAVAGLSLLLVSQAIRIAEGSQADDSRAVEAAIPVGGCVVSNNVTLLVASDRFISATPGCTEMTDPGGTELAFATDPDAGVGAYRAALSQANYLVVDGPLTTWLIGPYAPLNTFVAQHYHLIRPGRVAVYARDGIAG